MTTETKRVQTLTYAASDETVEVIIRIPQYIAFAIEGIGDQTLDLTKVHPDHHTRALARGWYERFKDAAAVNRADVDGNIISKAEHSRIKYERINDLAIHYESGTADWSRKGEGTGGGKSITIEAIARVRGITYAEAESKVEAHAAVMFHGDRKKALENLRTGRRVADAIKAIRDERTPAANIDADAALDRI